MDIRERSDIYRPCYPAGHIRRAALACSNSFQLLGGGHQGGARRLSCSVRRWLALVPASWSSLPHWHRRGSSGMSSCNRLSNRIRKQTPHNGEDIGRKVWAQLSFVAGGPAACSEHGGRDGGWGGQRPVKHSPRRVCLKEGKRTKKLRVWSKTASSQETFHPRSGTRLACEEQRGNVNKGSTTAADPVESLRQDGLSCILCLLCLQVTLMPPRGHFGLSVCFCCVLLSLSSCWAGAGHVAGAPRALCSPCPQPCTGGDGHADGYL